MACSIEGSTLIVADAFCPPILLDEEMINRHNRMIRNDFLALNPDLAGLHQNQVAGNLKATKKDFQEKFTADYFRFLEENNQHVENNFCEDT